MNDFRTLIIGAGIAGVSAALWLQDLEVAFDWIDARGEIGGVLHRVKAPIPNYPGVRAERGGRDVIERLEAQLIASRLKPSRARAEYLDVERLAAHVDGQERRYDAFIIATGTQPRSLSAIQAGTEARVSFSSFKLRDLARKQRFLIVGGGDGGFEGSLELMRAGAAEVVLVHHSPVFKARRSFREAVRACEGIITHKNSELHRLEFVDDALLARLDINGQKQLKTFDYCIVKIGVGPTVPEMSRALERSEEGYLVVDAHQQTSAARVFAAGDVCSPGFQSLVTSAAQASVAARRVVDLRDGIAE